MNENLEFDYTVTKKVEGKYLLHRLLMILGYIVFGMALIFGFYLAHLYQFIAFIILVEWIVIFFTWRYVSIEYRYETVSGGIKFYTVYGGKKKKLLLDMRIKDFLTVKPYGAETDGEEYAEELFCLSSEKDAPDRYVAIYKNAEGRLCTVHFEATQKALKIMRFYNSETVITDTRY